MGNNYLTRLNALQTKNFNSLQDLQKEKISLEYQENIKTDKPTLGFMSYNKVPKDDSKTRLKKINSEIIKIQNSINELNDLENFSGTIDDLKIVNYVDGHLDEDENKLFKRLIRVDIKLEKEIELMKSANSFFGEFEDVFEDEFEDLNESILENWLEIEENSKKNNLTLARPETQLQNIISKIKDFFRLRPIDLGFAGIAPLAVGAGLLYGTNSTIVASNPAIIQVAELSKDSQRIYERNIVESFPGSNTMIRSGEKNKIMNNFECSLPDVNINNETFIKYFNVRVTNPKTQKSFNMLNQDKLLDGNKVDFYFNFNKEGILFVDSLVNNKSNTLNKNNELIPCTTNNLLSFNYVPNKKIKLGQTYKVEPPWKKETLLVSFLEKNKVERLILGKLEYQPTTLKNFNKIFYNFKWNINPKSKVLKSDGLYNLYSELYKKPLYAPKIKSWGNNASRSNNKNIFIDFDGDDTAEMIAISNMEDVIIFYILDTNADAIGDVLVYPKLINKKNMGFQFLIDTNYDGEIDQIANDHNGDWKIDMKQNM